MTAAVVDPTVLPDSNEDQLRHEVAAVTLLLNQKNIIEYSGHVSVRLPGDETLLIQPVDHGRAELKPEQLLVCNLEGRRVLETEIERPPGEIFIHSEIYKARPDVRAIAHFHHDLTTTFSLVEGMHLQAIKNHAARWGSGIPVHPDPAHVNTPAVGRGIANTLESHHGMIIRAHGQVIVAENLRALLIDCIHFVENAETFYRAAGLGRVLPLTESELATFQRSFRRNKHSVKLWNYYVKQGLTTGLIPAEWREQLQLRE
nr:MAG: class II aldolase/adducin family protein [Hyphomicrobiales bacterium]